VKKQDGAQFVAFEHVQRMFRKEKKTITVTVMYTNFAVLDFHSAANSYLTLYG
jgi:hypothetical protein